MNPAHKFLIGGAFAAATLTASFVGANFLGTAGAQTSTTPAPTAQAPATQAPDSSAPDASGSGEGRHGGGGNGGPHQANGKTEAVLSGDDASKAIAAANAAVPGGIVVRAETDADGDVYEVHMTKSDGSHVTVKLDSNFTVTKTANGMG